MRRCEDAAWRALRARRAARSAERAEPRVARTHARTPRSPEGVESSLYTKAWRRNTAGVHLKKRRSNPQLKHFDRVAGRVRRGVSSVVRMRSRPGRSILIVDDDVDIRVTISLILEDEGYAVASAANGEEALRYLRSHPSPSLILLDLMMPGMDGVEFRAEQQRDAQLSGIPVVVVTASGNARERARAMQV